MPAWIIFQAEGKRDDWLPARLRWDEETFQIVNARSARLLKRNLGTIVADSPVRFVCCKLPNQGATACPVRSPWGISIRAGRTT